MNGKNTIAELIDFHKDAITSAVLAERNRIVDIILDELKYEYAPTVNRLIDRIWQRP